MGVPATDLAQRYAAKSNEELLALHGAGTLTAVAYDALESEMRGRGMLIPPRVEAEDVTRVAEQEFQKQTLRAHWRGEASLASAYWLVGTLGGWMLISINAVVEVYARQFLVFADLALLAFCVFASVSIWRCGRNTSWAGWGVLARIVVVLNALFVAALVLGSAVTGKH